MPRSRPLTNRAVDLQFRESRARFHLELAPQALESWWSGEKVFLVLWVMQGKVTVVFLTGLVQVLTGQSWWFDTASRSTAPNEASATESAIFLS